MSSRIVILGAGTGGTMVANRLHRELGGRGAEITVIDLNDVHVYQPGLLFVPFGLARPHHLEQPRPSQLTSEVLYIERVIDHVDVDRNTVILRDGEKVPYDVLVVATGSVLSPDATEGLSDAIGMNAAHHFYTAHAADLLEAALARFDGGRLVVNIVDNLIKYPLAPVEFCFLADWYFHQRGIRDRVEITFVTPLDGASTTALASDTLGSLLMEKNIQLVPEFNTARVDGIKRRLVGLDGRVVPFDLAVVIPTHSGAAYVGRSRELGDEHNFVPTDPHSMQSLVRPNIFVIGDAANIGVWKAGSVAYFEGDALVANVLHFIHGETLDASYDGHINGFIESGFGKALLIDFNYDTEPMAGRFPGTVGFPLLKESRLNHWGRVAFEWMYWHAVLAGRHIPGIRSKMPTAGKRPELGGAPRLRPISRSTEEPKPEKVS